MTSGGENPELAELRTVVELAKRVLIERHGQSELEAFTFIQNTAMTEREPMRVISQRIIDGTLTP